MTNVNMGRKKARESKNVISGGEIRGSSTLLLAPGNVRELRTL